MPPKPTPYHHGNLEAALVEAATSLIEERGPAALSLREAARSVGVSHTAPYRHFPNKQALLEAIAIKGFRDLSDALDTVLEQHPHDARQQLVAGGAAYVVEAVSHPRRAQLMFGGVLEQTSPTDDLKGAAESAFTRCIAIIQNGQQQGIFRQGSTRGMVLTFWASSHGLAMLLIANQFGMPNQGDNAETLWNLVAEDLLAGLMAEPA